MLGGELWEDLSHWRSTFFISRSLCRNEPIFILPLVGQPVAMCPESERRVRHVENALPVAHGVCLESEQASDKGVIAKVVVQNGSLLETPFLDIR